MPGELRARIIDVADPDTKEMREEFERLVSEAVEKIQAIEEKSLD